MSKAESFSFPVVSFRHLESPFAKDGYKDYFAVVDVSALPDFAGWRQINVRDPKLTGAVPQAIRQGLKEKPDTFLFMNRGIVLSAEKVSFENSKGQSQLTLTLSDKRNHGLLDGGHTYNIIREEIANLEGPRYVRVEILEGFSSEEITDVVDARNTSNQVRDESLMNLAGEFEKLKKALAGQPYADQIAYKEFEVDAAGNPKPIDVRDVIAILTAFDKTGYSDSVHPINTYRSKAVCLQHFKERKKEYEKIYPLAAEILELYDEIHAQLPELYNKVRGKTGSVTGGKFGRLTGVTVYKGKKSGSLTFTNKPTRYGVPAGFVYPILGAFRAILEEKGGRYVWGKGLEPLELIRGKLGERLADTIGNFALDAQNPSKTGKSPLVWQACYQAAQVEYLGA
jgi:AIPR protein